MGTDFPRIIVIHAAPPKRLTLSIPSAMSCCIAKRWPQVNIVTARIILSLRLNRVTSHPPSISRLPAAPPSLLAAWLMAHGSWLMASWGRRPGSFSLASACPLPKYILHMLHMLHCRHANRPCEHRSASCALQ
ncbi:hypothetical protein CC85DRAFT_282030 [Cutaneotrichosporon oleaginosum]|uniref:Uncharacterized protein n=1 Tax=Cutaneotrichosporon oleaginosum TaxID=879819 RepID=A0A0J0XXT5_9TREE|nr:uncharacterized protein CC85DRAFT_282030 [Cutaneotrichosporon oleaginosum]KLT45882.1 hypothetical protein CC85DRAFT_282030 [Cutaneotrichosporon oleaginosum]TXT06583.1 hypothetical protein COLE_05914 [Cutaneotrichosporon oleaginosum]